MTMEQVNEAKEAQSVGMDPMLGKSYGEIVKDIGKRFFLLLSKLISFKTAVLALFAFLYVRGQMETWAIVVIAGLAIFGREFLKFMKDVR